MSRMKGGVGLLSIAMRTIDFEAVFLSTLFSFELIFTASRDTDLIHIL